MDTKKIGQEWPTPPLRDHCAPLVLSCDLFNHSDHLRMTTYQLPSLIHPSMRRLIFLGCSTPKYSTGTGFGRTGFSCISFLKSLPLVCFFIRSISGNIFTDVGYEAGLFIVVHHEVRIKAWSTKDIKETIIRAKPFTEASQLKLNGLAHIVGNCARAARGPEIWDLLELLEIKIVLRPIPTIGALALVAVCVRPTVVALPG